VWKRTNAFYGKPWIWNMLHNFGGNISLFGRMETVASEPAKALHNPASGQMKGIGLTMEGIEQNPVLYELMMHHTWQEAVIDLNRWLPQYVLNRYGIDDEHALKAWDLLRRTVYNGEKIRDGAESIIAARPTFDSMTRWAKTVLNYNAEDLLPAWESMINAAPACKTSDGFRYDLVDVTRQVLANYALPLQRKIVTAYERKDINDFKKLSAAFITLIDDMDQLLATRKDFLLGTWISDARRWGTTPQEKALYERNARNLITLWGDTNSPLHEYACRQWSGLLNDFYKPRWQQFFATATAALQKGSTMDIEKFQKDISQWEWQWVNSQKAFSVQPSGDPVAVAKKMFQKYRSVVAAAYAPVTTPLTSTK
jgi:alpha-N-acetylglucosaminidase